MQEEKVVYGSIILGSGPAGLTAAIYASRSKVKTLVVTGVPLGGQLMLTTEVEDFPGFPEGVQGPDLVFKMKEQAEKFGTEVVQEDAVKVDFSKKKLEVEVTSGQKYFGKTVIIATGASAKWLGLESEQKLIGKGVSSCAVCDAAFFRDKEVVVVGGGDTAVKEALFLTKFASRVTVIHRRDTLKAFQAMQEKAFKNPKIKFVWNSVIEEVLGEAKVTGIKVKDLKTDQTQELKTDAVFVAIGHNPNTSVFQGQIDLDQGGYIKLHEETKTSVPGVFAAGDVHDLKYKQAVTAASAGCKAAMDVEEYLNEEA